VLVKALDRRALIIVLILSSWLKRETTGILQSYFRWVSVQEIAMIT
jgi:hypothetical protein